ncbi:alginate O-acetyltransferase AlgX-related protein [Deinococcus fonticola]|uniref:alginate O-acetyltransferase AlgX-related protein n=1 Tax=Deinococcus fonticola TaxID=2528713 RepID=UPI0014315737|nr:hypothetical protein [Deinococcus fonticola]
MRWKRVTWLLSLLGLVGLSGFVVVGRAQAPQLCPAARTELKTLVTDGRGRLFTATTLQQDFDARAFRADLQDMARRLTRLNSSLVAVPVPWKALLVVPPGNSGSPQLLGFEPLKARQGYWSVTNTFRAAGIPTLDVLSLYLNSGETPYFKTDHHWTARGAELAAAGIRPLLTPLTLQRLGNPAPLPPPTFQGTVEFTGSHAALADTVCPPVWPLEKTFQSVTVGLPEQGLLDEAALPVLLFGSSFSRSARVNDAQALPSYGFEQWLSADLGVAVQNEAFSSGSQGSWLEYLAQHLGEPLPPLIVWEMPIADFARDHQAATALFFDQLIPLLSLTEFPGAPPTQVLQQRPFKQVKAAYDLGPLPAQAFVQVRLSKATALSPRVTVEGTGGQRTVTLRREGNKAMAMPGYALRLPRDLGTLKRLVLEWPVASNDLAPQVEAVTIHALK